MFTKLIVPLDRSSLAESAIGKATSIALNTHAAIDVVIVHEPFPFSGYVDLDTRGDEALAEQKYVEAIAAEIALGAGIFTTSALLRGPPAGKICERARDTGADLIVMTSHGRTGFSRLWLGSVADDVMRGAPVPVLMLRPERSPNHERLADTPFKRMLIPLDGSALASGVLPAALALADASHASVSLIRVSPPVPVVIPYDLGLAVAYPPVVLDEEATNRVAEEATGQLEELARRLHDETQLPVDATVVVGDEAAESIVNHAAAHDIDVIAMSTHGRGASRWLFGSVADKVLRGSRIPILLCRPLEVAAPDGALEVEENRRTLATA